MTFEKLQSMVDGIKGVDPVTIGHSVMGRPIYAFHVGDKSGEQVIVHGAIHAREWITSLLVVELLHRYRNMYSSKSREGACTQRNKTTQSGGIWFIPLCNPDGVQIALSDDPLWKANARGVDLNVNFDAGWGTGTQNVFKPGSENYIGPHPNSEPEVQALIDFTLKIRPKATIAYHSKGEVVYYPNPNDRQLAETIADITDYDAIQTRNSAGGYSDWVVKHLGVPALTIEVGNDEKQHPINIDSLPEIIRQNQHVIAIILNDDKNTKHL